jgi:hypothetical protein
MWRRAESLSHRERVTRKREVARPEPYLWLNFQFDDPLAA